MCNKISSAAFYTVFFIFSFSFSVYRQKAAGYRIFVSYGILPHYFCSGN